MSKAVEAVCGLLGSVSRHSWGATLRCATLLVVLAACVATVVLIAAL